MNLRVNQDGKLWDRFIASAIPVAIGLALAGIVWWKDASNADSRASEAISRIETRIDRVEAEAREARRAAAEDRQKTAELAADVRNVLRSTGRIEALLDRWNSVPPSPSRP
ncbi:hypothetical protein [Bosea sp. (in: a-proteobacteria)]|uniref:hypothetical protein n=1 Tax=Bosea sp. (in: a-proteobacteria) TaxID=1871050 RepID=UPI00260CA861|nr:hypothetical protein [Bosea sp. (in: a-proteobacteria)]MCO5092682.1 hypothetical protein [Bosea sp. (in: a-proteobacteria)]